MLRKQAFGKFFLKMLASSLFLCYFCNINDKKERKITHYI